MSPSRLHPSAPTRRPTPRPSPGRPVTAGGRRRARARLVLAGLLLLAAGCGSGKRDDVLVLVDANSPLSKAIGTYYVETRAIDPERLLALDLDTKDPTLRSDAHESITPEAFRERIAAPVLAYLEAEDPDREIAILVTTKGIPLRVGACQTPPETWLRDCALASVDAELAVLGSGLEGRAGIEGMANPFFDSPLSYADARDEDDALPLRFLVARLTSFAEPVDDGTGLPADLLHMLEAAAAPTERGRWQIVESGDPDGPHGTADRLVLAPAAGALARLALEVDHRKPPAPLEGDPPLAGYAAWGPPAAAETPSPGHFAPRAIATNLVPANARTFTRASGSRAGAPSGRLGELIRSGAAGVAGHVDEPTLPGVVRPAVLFEGYTSGRTAVEAYYRALPYLGWMNVYVGDPLMQLDAEAAGVVVPEGAPDRDGDGREDGDDDCPDRANPDQRDTDGDGRGNACDADVDNDGRVTTSWGAIFPRSKRGDIEAIALVAENGPYDPDMDLDGDGKVDARDLAIAQLDLFRPLAPAKR